MKSKWMYMLCLAALLISCQKAQVRVELDGFRKNTTLDFAIQELETYLQEAALKSHVSANFHFIFRRDSTFHRGEFACKATAPYHFLLTGGDEISVSHAVYTWLETLGYTFDFSKSIEPAQFQFAAVEQIDTVIVPKVRWRGIRQHVNFPMDISSYPIGEAKEYLHNLVRLRFNKLAIHSYPFIWYEETVADSTVYGGSFFYGHPHLFARNQTLKKAVRFNDSIFCIPNIEESYADKVQKSTMGIAWMKELLAYAKQIGLQVQFSFEPRDKQADETVAIARKIVETYPDIDVLEIITEELGGWGNNNSRQEIEATLKHYFTEEICRDSLVVASIREQQVDLNSLYAQIGNAVNSIQLLEKDTEFRQKVGELKIAIYCTTSYAPVSHHLARKALPTHQVSVMPSHGSDGVARAMTDLVKTQDDLMATDIYSWIEFDGLMYQQQNAINGIYHLLQYVDSIADGKQIPSICFNHWRTVENRTTARYAAQVTLDGVIDPMAFFQRYAARLGISDPMLYASAMSQLNDVDSFSTTSLGNIGFCWVGAWSHAGLFNWMNVDNIKIAIDMYTSAGEKLSKLATDTTHPDAKAYLLLLGNRTLCSILYLQAFKEATAIRTIQSNPSAEEMKKAAEICDYALALFNQYIDMYAQLLPDRGSEGTIVSVWNSPIYGLKLLREKLAGIPLDELPHSEKPIDAPPLPIFYTTH